MTLTGKLILTNICLYRFLFIENSLNLFDILQKESKINNFFNQLNQLQSETIIKTDNQLNEKINQFINGFELLNIFYNANKNNNNNNINRINQIRQSLEELKKEIENILRIKLKQLEQEIKNNPYQDIKNLIEKYKSLVYLNGRFIDIRKFL